MENDSRLLTSVGLESENESTDAVDFGIFKAKEDHESCTVMGKTLDADIGEYYFESDHMAVKCNKDYRNLLKTLAVLEAQRIQAIKDTDRLMDVQREALADPITFVDKLQRNVDLNLPLPQHVAPLPQIDWSKYSHGVKTTSFSRRHTTRNKVVPTTSLPAHPPVQEPSESKTESDDSSHVPLFIRGRPVMSLSKSQTFNQLWTAEEQKRLEDLLVKYPPEDVEARRWEKVAKDLGNRTPQQVASRVQKYFIKLTKAGLPVPGRIPNMSSYSKRTTQHRHHHHRHNRFLFHQSTFFASHDPPVFMSELDEDYTAINSPSSSMDSDFGMASTFQDNDLISPELKNTEEYKELMFLEQLKKKRSIACNDTKHIVFKCDKCGCQLIIGKRWQCLDCPSSCPVNLCDKCHGSNFETSRHTPSHQLEAVHEGQNSLFDRDYTQFLQGDYNYLDPNYMPAT